MVNKYMKRHSKSLVIEKMKVLTTRDTTPSKDVEQLSHTAGGNGKWSNHFGEQFGSFLKS